MQGGDVSFNGATLAVVAGLLSALSATVGLLFRSLIESYKEQITYLQQRNQLLEDQADQGTGLAEAATFRLKQRERGR